MSAKMRFARLSTILNSDKLDSQNKSPFTKRRDLITLNNILEIGNPANFIEKMRLPEINKDSPLNKLSPIRYRKHKFPSENKNISKVRLKKLNMSGNASSSKFTGRQSLIEHKKTDEFKSFREPEISKENTTNWLQFEQIHKKFINSIHNFKDIMVDFDLTFSIFHLLFFNKGMLKEENEQSSPTQKMEDPIKNQENLEKENADFNTIVDILLNNMDSNIENRVTNFQKNLFTDFSENTKILRYILRDLIKDPKYQQKALILDLIWKYAIISIDTFFEFDTRKMQKCKENTRAENELKIFELNQKIQNINTEFGNKIKEIEEKLQSSINHNKFLKDEKVFFFKNTIKIE